VYKTLQVGSEEERVRKNDHQKDIAILMSLMEITSQWSNPTSICSSYKKEICPK
jgi:iron-sulfur cluster repair protein YtfE (RIC family)